MKIFHLTDTRRDVLKLIAEGRSLEDSVPCYRPAARRGRGAFPVTIAERAERELFRAGLVERTVDGALRITAAGRAALEELLGAEMRTTKGTRMRTTKGTRLTAAWAMATSRSRPPAVVRK